MEKKVMSVEEMAVALGLGRSKAYELVHAIDGPPVIRIGRCIRVPVDGLSEWLERQSEGRAEI